MAFVVEDGTGKSDATSYASVASLKAYFDDRGLSYATYTDDQIQRALIDATDFLERTYTWATGRKGSKTQALGWPRLVAYDSDGYAFETTEIPLPVVRATIVAAKLVLSGETLIVNPTQKVIEERVEGAVSVKYDSNSPAETRWSEVDLALGSLVYSSVMVPMVRG